MLLTHVMYKSGIENSSDVFKFWFINVGVSAHVSPDDLASAM
jgi:hypothetical protein